MDALFSSRLMLRPLQTGDAEAIWAYRSLPEVARYQSWDGYTLGDAERLVEEQREVVPDTPDSWLQLAIVESESRLLIGDCGLHFLGEDGEQVELGITLAPSHQGKGLATEALNCVLAYLFGELNKRRVVATTDAENWASARLLERVGFRKEAHFIENIYFKGAWGSEFAFALLRREREIRTQGQGRELGIYREL